MESHAPWNKAGRRESGVIVYRANLVIPAVVVNDSCQSCSLRRFAIGLLGVKGDGKNWAITNTQARGFVMGRSQTFGLISLGERFHGCPWLDCH